jgi:hypothetical protein
MDGGTASFIRSLTVGPRYRGDDGGVGESRPHKAQHQIISFDERHADFDQRPYSC